jgi:hypothetical protein
VIRYFGTRKKIFNVHFRNIRGHWNDFVGCIRMMWISEGYPGPSRDWVSVYVDAGSCAGGSAVVHIWLWVYSRLDSVAGVRHEKSLHRWLAAEALSMVRSRCYLSADFSAYYLHRRNQARAEQQESGGLRCYLSDLASDFSTRKGGVVNVGVSVSAIQGGNKARFR